MTKEKFDEIVTKCWDACNEASGENLDVSEADVFLGMLERAEKRAEEAKVKDSEKEVEKLVEKLNFSK